MTFKCQTCGRPYPRLDWLLEHARNAHGRAPVFTNPVDTEAQGA